MALPEADAPEASPPPPAAAAAASPPMVSIAADPLDHAALEATTTAANGKRKRSGSAVAPPRKSPDEMRESTEERRRAAMAEIASDLLVVLKENDPGLAVLAHPVPSASPPPPEGPPSKRAKLSPATPNTIADRLAAGAYATLNPVLADISAVCRSLLASGDAPVAQIVHFEESARDVITRERLRRADLFDFAEEFSGEEGARGAAAAAAAAAGGKVALTVMGHHGPLFSSLQNPISVPVPAHRPETLSRSSSTSGSPSSTAPTSTATSPKTGPLKVYRVIAPLNEAALPPLISTVKPASNDPRSPLKPGKEGEKIPTLAEAFPPTRTHTLAPPKPYPTNNPPAIGLKWGGVLAPGGVPSSNPSFTRPDPTGEWLSYRNHPPRDSKYRPRRGEPIRLGMGLPADFVVAYSSFAPTRDDSGAKVPTRMRERVWWERRGGELFRRVFKTDPGVGHLFTEYDRSTIDPTLDPDIMDTDTDKNEDEVFRQAVDSWEPTTDFNLLSPPPPPSTPSETLLEISTLLKTLRSHQYTRLSTLPPLRINTGTTSSPPPSPTPEEQSLYNTLHTRLTTLISSLPPHTTSTTDGTPHAPLTISSKLPIQTQTYTGTLPSDANPVQHAATAALNAAVGLSPAPVAVMTPRLPNVTYQTVTTPLHYPSPYAPGPRVVGAAETRVGMQFHGHSMPVSQRRVSVPVPPPQGLAAVGVGVGYREELRMGVQHTQASMENGVVPGGRYAGRSRR